MVECPPPTTPSDKQLGRAPPDDRRFGGEILSDHDPTATDRLFNFTLLAISAFAMGAVAATSGGFRGSWFRRFSAGLARGCARPDLAPPGTPAKRDG
jgi:hypothetical protein